MFGALKFRNEFAFPVPGIPPAIYNAGSVGGTAIPVACMTATSAGPVGNYMNFKKWGFIATLGSTSVAGLTYQVWVGGASTSNGTFSVLGSSSVFAASNTYGTTAQSASVSAGAKVYIEVRGEYLSALPNAINWIKPIVSISGGSANINVESLAFVTGSDPASNGDYGGGTGGIVLQEIDLF